MCALLQMNASGMLAHLAATLSARLVAIRIKTLVCLTVAGAAGLVTPPASGTRQVGPVDTDITGQLSCLQCRRKNTAVFYINVEGYTFSRSNCQSSCWDSHRCNPERSSASWCTLTRVHRGSASTRQCSWSHNNLQKNKAGGYFQ